MTSKAIVTAVARVALAGGALVVVTAPASSAAPGCQYPANIVTTTSLKVKPQKVQYGAGARARVVVRATGSGRTPKGQVIVSVAGRSRVAGLSGGAAPSRSRASWPPVPTTASGRSTTRSVARDSRRARRRGSRSRSSRPTRGPRSTSRTSSVVTVPRPVCASGQRRVSLPTARPACASRTAARRASRPSGCTAAPRRCGSRV